MKKILISLFLLSGLVACASKVNPTRDVANWADGITPPDPGIYPYRVQLDKPHEMRIINDGVTALYDRVKMIREAQHTLELEYFIFNPDTAGRIIVTELAKAAKRGVKVRVLVDKSLAVFALDPFFAKVFGDHKIELRYYNPASAIQVSTVQFRDHRKLITRDGVEAITGGRNIADEYFHLAKEFNFLDRDIWVKGEVVQAMVKSFDLYWDADIVQTPTFPKAPEKKINYDVDDEKRIEAAFKAEMAKFNKKSAEAEEVAVLTDEDQKILDYVMDYGAKNSDGGVVRNCPSIAFATDREGGNFLARLKSKDYHENYRLLRKEIALWLTKIDDEVLLDSPYFLNDKRSREILHDLLERNKKVTILTNSLASTDAVYVSTVFSDEVKKYAPNKNFNAYIYKGNFSNESEIYNDEIKKSIWGTHSKTMVFNDKAFMVGTFNVDNRSNFYNSEMALFCQGSAELTKDVEDNIRVRMKNSHHLNEKGMPDDGTRLLEGNSAGKKGIYFLLKAPSKMLQFLL